jgi:hypothetical protein
MSRLVPDAWVQGWLATGDKHDPEDNKREAYARKTVP